MLSLIPEPITGLVDTAFVKLLGAAPLAALGVATVTLSGALWAFNFLGVGTQTEVAHAHGGNDRERAANISGTAIAVSLVIALAMGLFAWPFLEEVSAFMGARGEVSDAAVAYLEIRLLGGPAMLATMAAMGALRGVQDMRTPLQIAVVVNVLNVALDAVLITGAGPIPGYGVAGAAWATVVSQTAGAVWALLAVRRRLGRPARVDLRDAGRLLVVGRDLFLRTGLLVAFILLTTRSATYIGNESGAAHQAIRQVWLLTALALDAFAATAQSLVGYFLGAARPDLARRVCGVACGWGLAAGVALLLGMLASEGPVAALLVPDSAWSVFTTSWLIAALAQPINALSFVTDGIHWATRDYRYLRNAMFGASALGAAGLLYLDSLGDATLPGVWVVTTVWVGFRAFFGVARVWPGIFDAPLASKHTRGTRRGAY
jgi:MATE family multidrug resistance protein